MYRQVLLTDLKKVCVECGISSGGRTKSELTNYITDYLTNIKQIDRIISLDLGYKNFAISDINVRERKLMDWKKLCIEIPSPFCPKSFTKNLAMALEPIKNMVTTETVILVERQRQRTASSGILERILVILMIEAQIYATFPDLCEPMLPQRVGAHFGLGTGKEKKRDAVEVVNNILKDENSILQISKELKTIFLKEKKKDDLADSFLQGMAYLQWHLRRLEYSSKLATQGHIIPQT